MVHAKLARRREEITLKPFNPTLRQDNQPFYFNRRCMFRRDAFIRAIMPLRSILLTSFL